MKTKKQFGQHWLKSEKALNRIVTAAQLRSQDRILEIGPGTGILTSRLLETAQGVVAVEIDRDLCKKLVKKLGERENFLLLQGDFLEMDIESCLASFPQFQPLNKVVANIPYNITSPILEKLLGTISNPHFPAYESIVLLVQKEIGDRLTATPGGKIYGAMSVRVQYLADCEFIADVPAKAFSPPPKVDSAIIRLSPRLFPTLAKNTKRLETLVKVGFGNKRKMLRNNLKGIIDSDKLTPILEQLNINPQARAEDLSVQDWVNLSNCLENEHS